MSEPNSMTCQDPEHRHFRDPANGRPRCIDHEEAWLDRMEQATRAYRQRQRQRRLDSRGGGLEVAT